MSQPLSSFARQFVIDEKSARAAWIHPVLLWTSEGTASKELLYHTAVSGSGFRPRAGDPLVFEVKKQDSTLNAFGLGVTLGRVKNNDIQLDDDSVSRFHAYFQRDPKGHWTLADAESSNGTWVNMMKLSPKTPVVLEDEATIRIGKVQAMFYMPNAFLAFVKKTIAGGGSAKSTG